MRCGSSFSPAGDTTHHNVRLGVFVVQKVVKLHRYMDAAGL